MTDDKDKIEVGHEVHTQAVPLLPAVTKKYTYYAVKSLYGQIQFRVKTDDIRTGLSFGAPEGYTVMVAFVRPGQEKTEEELREGAITFEEFSAQWEQMTVLMKMSRDTYTMEGF